MAKHRLVLLLLCLLCGLATPCLAAEWPDNWLGPADNKYVHLRIGVFYYGAVLDDLPAEAGGKSPLPMGWRDTNGKPLPGSKQGWFKRLAAMPEQSRESKQAEYERTMAELQENARFYWRNTRFNCAITYENVETSFEPELRSGLLKNDPPYNGPVDFPRYDAYREQYDGLLHICVLYKYNRETGALDRVQGGGGWTWGCALSEKVSGKHLCGWSWWNAPPASHDCGSDWLFCHEFGHQLDSLFHESGHPEHWFNHLSRAEANTARFGEHFDCMSYILRRTPEADWQDLKWGEVRQYADADNDGAPDQDDWLVAANLELDPDPATSDCDGEGLSDRDELLAMNGNRFGHGERLHPGLGLLDPAYPNCDRDGLLDDEDPLPWLELSAFVPQTPDSARASWLSGPDDPQAQSLVDARPCSISLPKAHGLSLSGIQESPFGTVAVENLGQPLMLNLAYEQDKALVIDLAWGSLDRSDADSECRLVLDLENDGWFNGDDNYRFQIDSTGLAYAALNKASSYTEWPSEDKEAVDKAACGFEWMEAQPSYRYACRLRLDKAQFPSFQGKAGERIGINYGVRNKGERWFYTIGEPNTQFPLELR